MSIVEKLHFVDDRVFGYRYGFIFWLSMWAVSVGILSADSTQGHGRDYLTNTVREMAKLGDHDPMLDEVLALIDNENSVR